MEKKALKQKALEPHERYCTLLRRKVTVLIEYQDYKHPGSKGDEGTLYCSNIIECYHNGMRCKWSGISPLYRDPLVPLDQAKEYMEPE
ncbi:MAG: hypothetical protein HYU64_01160 [Armatimonadetes bacterium]|nr:hypothetical protein [Armatimonadota bacterium]